MLTLTNGWRPSTRRAPRELPGKAREARSAGSVTFAGRSGVEPQMKVCLPALALRCWLRCRDCDFCCRCQRGSARPAPAGPAEELLSGWAVGFRPPPSVRRREVCRWVVLAPVDGRQRLGRADMELRLRRRQRQQHVPGTATARWLQRRNSARTARAAGRARNLTAVGPPSDVYLRELWSG